MVGGEAEAPLPPPPPGQDMGLADDGAKAPTVVVGTSQTTTLTIMLFHPNRQTEGEA